MIAVWMGGARPTKMGAIVQTQALAHAGAVLTQEEQCFRGKNIPCRRRKGSDYGLKSGRSGHWLCSIKKTLLLHSVPALPVWVFQPAWGKPAAYIYKGAALKDIIVPT